MTETNLNEAELEISKIYKLDIRKITSDNYDEEEEFGYYECLADCVIAQAKDKESNEYSIIEYKRFNQAIERFILPTAFPSIDQIEETLNKNEYTRNILDPLDYQSTARIICSSINGELTLKVGEELDDEFIFSQYADGGYGENYYPCLFVFRYVFSELKDVVFTKGNYSIQQKKEKENLIFVNSYDLGLKNIAKNLFVFEEVNGDTKTIL